MPCWANPSTVNREHQSGRGTASGATRAVYTQSCGHERVDGHMQRRRVSLSRYTHTLAVTCCRCVRVRGGGSCMSSHSTSKSDKPSLCRIAALPLLIHTGESSCASDPPTRWRLSADALIASNIRFFLSLTCTTETSEVAHEAAMSDGQRRRMLCHGTCRYAHFNH